ncbi:MAG: protein kinase [Chloroflexota bacterium]
MVTEKIGHYLIEEIIGSGGMARVYKAFDDRVKRYVAVKMLSEHFTHQDYLFERFEQEARLIASLEHHAIVPVYDYGNHDGRPYIVMRLMTGGSLADRLEEGAVDLKSVSNILTRIAAALDKAHANDVIHRDIKPGNILFDEDGIAFLADFGIARFSEMTQSGVVVGSPHYMSPEQARGHPIDSRSDVYQLGVLLFEMLTGSLPYDGESIDSVIYQHVHEPVPRLTNYNPDLPSNLQGLINNALAKDRDNRISTAVELASRFTKLVPSEDNPSPRGIVPARLSGRMMRRTLSNIETDTVIDYPVRKRRAILPRLLMWLIGIVALLLLVYQVPAVRSNPTVDYFATTLSTAFREVPSVAQDLQDWGADAVIEITGNATETPSPTPTIVPTATEVPPLVLPSAEPPSTEPPPTLPPTEVAVVVPPTNTPVPPTETPTETPSPTLGVPEPTSTPDQDVIPPTEVSPDTLINGRELAELTGSSGSLVFSLRKFNENKFNLYVRDVEENLIQLTSADENDFGAVWSPDGSVISFFSEQGDRAIKILQPDGTSPTFLTNNLTAEEYPKFDPSGETIIFHSNRPFGENDTFRFGIYTISSDGPVNSEERLIRNGRDNYAPSYSPDGKKIAYESQVGPIRQIYVYDIETGEETPVTFFLTGWARHPVWSPDSEDPKLAFFYERDGTSEIYTVNPEDGTDLTQVTAGFDFNGFHPSWSPNGEYLIFHADMNEENNNRDLWMIKPNGTGLRRITNTPDREIQPKLRPPATAEEQR